MINKVKVFQAKSFKELETEINDWVELERVEIIAINSLGNGRDYFAYKAMICYKEEIFSNKIKIND